VKVPVMDVVLPMFTKVPDSLPLAALEPFPYK